MTRHIMRSTAITGTVVFALSWTTGRGSAQEKGTAAKQEKAKVATPAKTTAGKAWPLRTWGGQPDITGVWGSADTGNWSWNYEPRDYLYSIGMQKSDGLIQG